jgi:hypothetical protein
MWKGIIDPKEFVKQLDHLARTTGLASPSLLKRNRFYAVVEHTSSIGTNLVNLSMVLDR